MSRRYNNDFGEFIDMILNSGKVQKAFITKGHRRWIEKVDDTFLRNALNHLTNKQISLIEKIMFEDKSLLDCANEECKPAKEIYREIMVIKHVLISYI